MVCCALCRAELLLRQAMRSVPIAVDHETPLDVVYEDEDFIAVNKPVGFHTAPIHRWQGGSIVSILLSHFSKTAAAAAAAAGDAPQQKQGSATLEQQQQEEREQQQQQQQQQRPEQPALQQQQQQEPERLPSHVAAVKPYVLHRLDYNTSGLLLIGKRRDVVPGVAMQFR
jgi:23S rRNA-/tRNA-specific pseudouridylate synthase